MQKEHPIVIDLGQYAIKYGTIKELYTIPQINAEIMSINDNIVLPPQNLNNLKEDYIIQNVLGDDYV